MNYFKGQTPPTLHHTLHRTVGAYTPFAVSYDQINLFNTVGLLLDSKQLGLTKFTNTSLHTLISITAAQSLKILNMFLKETMWKILRSYFMKLKLFRPKLNNNTTLMRYSLRWTR